MSFSEKNKSPKSWIQDYAPQNPREEGDREHLLKLPEFFIGVDRSLPYHYTVSAMVVEEEGERVLLIHHPIYNSWGWSGGHVEEGEDLFTAAVRELYEETGLEYVGPGDRSPVAFHLLPVKEHERKGEAVEAHFHVNFTFGFTARAEDLPQSGGELKSLWVPISQLAEYVTEAHMLPIYREILNIMDKKNPLS
ncbi:MAG: NUDIX domain-containing protein [Tissierellia bacterium]|nr:NUDIX domain-containing protein [Tissierellia bacterium]